MKEISRDMYDSGLSCVLENCNDTNMEYISRDNIKCTCIYLTSETWTRDRGSANLLWKKKSWKEDGEGLGTHPIRQTRTAPNRHPPGTHRERRG